MKVIVLTISLILASSSAQACGCWKKYVEIDNPSNQLSFTFKVISGDAIHPVEKQSEGKYLTTEIEVFDSGTSNRKLGERLKLIQVRNFCSRAFYPPYHYTYIGASADNEITANSCNVKRSPRENDEKKFEEWLSSLKAEANEND